MEMDRLLILGMEHVSLLQFIDATMLGAPIGNAVTIYRVYNFQIIFRGFFFFCSPLVS
jgi:hypothetical protein